MRSDPPQDTLRSPAPPDAAPRRDKMRIRFKKGGDLRLVSHHDLMHCFERMFRRAALPFHSTEGFNPKPKMAFALSLALGIVGCEEVLELELKEPLSPEEVHERLARQAPAGLEILSVRRIDRKLRAQVRRVCYRIAVPADRAAELPARCAAVLASDACWVERSRPQPRRLDVRPYLRDLRLVQSRPEFPEESNDPLSGGRKPPEDVAPFATLRSQGAYAPRSEVHPLSSQYLDGTAAPHVLEMDLWVTPYGTVRPQEVLGLVGLQDLLEAGAVLERTKLALHDEDQTPDSGPSLGPPVPADGRCATGKSSPRPAPLLPGPLSFDS